MGKMRGGGPMAPNKRERHDPLHVQLAGAVDEDAPWRTKQARAKFAKRRAEKETKEKEEFVSPNISRKILEIAREQQEEEEGGVLGDERDLAHIPRLHDPHETYSDENEELGASERDDEEEYFEELELEEGDQEVLSKFFPSPPLERRNLAHLIMEKIDAQREARGEVHVGPDNRIVPQGLNPKVVEAYTKVGQLLSRYTSGKLPKAFKIIPSLRNWEEILYLTDPERWTPHAMYQATRIFVSNLKAKQSQRFFQLVLLDRVRGDIAENKKLNYHLYMALKKALYKPAAFFKGIIFPLCESGTCTLREAVIIGSVMSKVSIPVLHSSAALLKIAEMEYTGPNSLFLRVLLDKKYALPFKVVDAVVFHFLRFKSDPRQMPVLWYQSFLVFAQRYKEDMTPEQKEALLELLKHKIHEAISPEIRRELVNSTCRGEIKPPLAMDVS